MNLNHHVHHNGRFPVSLRLKSEVFAVFTVRVLSEAQLSPDHKVAAAKNSVGLVKSGTTAPSTSCVNIKDRGTQTGFNSPARESETS